ETVFPHIVAQVFGIDEALVTLKASDPSGPALIGGGTVGSRSMVTHGAALFATAQAVVKKGLDLAARHLEAAAQDIEFSDGQYRVKGTDVAVSFQELAKTCWQELGTLDGVPTATAFPGGVH